MPEEIIEQNNEQRSGFSRHIWTIILVIFILGFSAFVVKSIVDDHDRNKTATTTREQIAREFTPDSNQSPATNSGQQSPAAENSNPTPDLRGSTPSNPPQVLGAETPAPTSAPQFKPYRNNAFGFSTMIPTDAQVAETSEKLTANGPAGIYWTVTKYDNTTETLDSIENQLSHSPSVSTLSRTTLGSIPALVFTSPNLNGGTGYALILNNRLYYLVGKFDQPELWRDWKFF